jgi:4-alpha-glucanotransferase
MTFTRSSGILLHPTSLPGRFGIGDLGPQAFAWVDFLDRSGTGLWQILPLGPTGYADSPYQCFSALAGNPYLISPELLVEDGLLSEELLNQTMIISPDAVEYGMVIPWKVDLLDQAFQTFKSSGDLKKELAAYKKQNQDWLPDFALFMALKQEHNLEPWPTWDAPLRDRDHEALEEAQKRLELEIERNTFYQFLFDRQWQSLRVYANKRGIKIIGDIPIYVAHDSSDVWANRELFHIDELGQPTVVAGVPPDYFSTTGQLWGNPIYRWELHAETGFAWWLQRIRKVLEQVDIIRLDHFRGFAGYWEVPGDAETAVNGRWVPGPGAPVFEAMLTEFGELPLIAEDLGHITPDVTELRLQFHLPGMKIFQFGFEEGNDHHFMPHNYVKNCVAYSGTHDNSTATGWYHHAIDHHRWVSRDYLGLSEPVKDKVFAEAMINRLWESAAVFTLAPLQDFLGLGDGARMNYPGTTDGNWRWRVREHHISGGLADRLLELNRRTNRSKG